MRWLILKPLKGAFIVFCVVFGAQNSHGQASCGCPPVASCNPCAGGISTITFKNHGPSTYIWIMDNGEEIFDDWVVSGATFIAVGQSNGKFQGNIITVNGLIFSQQEINITCGMEFDPTRHYGNLTMVAATSKKAVLLLHAIEARVIDNSWMAIIYRNWPAVFGGVSGQSRQ